MRSTSIFLSLLAVAISSVRSQAIDTEDVPSSCQSVCSAVVGAADACEEIDSEDEDDSDWVCVCAQPNMSTAIPECLACVESAPASGEEDDEDECKSSHSKKSQV